MSRSNKFVNHKNKSKTLNKRVNKIEKLMKAHKPELKHRDVTITGQAAVDTWTVKLLNGISEGTTDSNRIGQVISMQKIQMKLQIEKTSVYNRNTLVRFALIYDDGCEGAAFDTADIFNVNNIVDSYLKLPFSKRYKVLWDKTFALNQVDGTYDEGSTQLTSSNRIRWMPKTIKLRNLPVKYDSTGNTITSISSGSLYFIHLSDRGTDSPSVSARFRLRYFDN